MTELLKYFNIDINMNTDPKLLKKILIDDMLLYEFDPFRKILMADLEKPISLKPMLEKIMDGIVNKQPALLEFLTVAVKEGIFPFQQNSAEYINRTLHTTYLLDLLTKEIYNDTNFGNEIFLFLLKKREELGIRSNFFESIVDFYKITGSFFITIKTLTVDYAIQSGRDLTKYDIVPWYNLFEHQFLLNLNITEAVITDRLNSMEENALTGIALIINPLKEIKIIPGENRKIEFILSQEWTSLYETWNLAFITGNLNNLDLLYPKLIIPEVLCSDNNQYLPKRSISLWLAINFLNFRYAMKKKELIMPGSKALAKRWGEINLKHAKKYTKNQNGKELNDYSILYTFFL